MSISADLTPPAVRILPEDQSLTVSTYDHVIPPPTGPQRTTTDIVRAVFSIITCHDDLVDAYPDLKPLCLQLGFAEGMTLTRWCSSPEWMLLILARAAQPPPPAILLDWSNTDIPMVIDHLVTGHHRTTRNELSRIGIIIHDLTCRHTDAASIYFGQEFLRFAADVLTRLDHAEVAVFPACIAITSQRQGTGLAGKVSDIAQRLHAMMVNNDHSGLEIGLLLNQVTMLIHQHGDPDLIVVKRSLAVLALAMASHATTEQNLLASEVLFTDGLNQAQNDPSYCVRVPGDRSAI